MITFESNLLIKQGAGGLTYFSADAGTGVVTMAAPNNETTVLNISVGSISVAGNIITGGGIGGSRVSAGDGTVGSPYSILQILRGKYWFLSLGQS